MSWSVNLLSKLSESISVKSYDRNSEILGRSQIYFNYRQIQRLLNMSEEASRVPIVDRKSRPDLKLQEKWSLVAFCMENYDWENRRIADGRRKEAMDRFEVTRMTVTNVVADYVQQICSGSIYPDLAPKSRSGRESIRTQEIEEQILALLRQRFPKEWVIQRKIGTVR